MSRRSARKNAFYLLFQLGFTKSEEDLINQKNIFFREMEEEIQRKIDEEEARVKAKKQQKMAELKAKETIDKAIENSLNENLEDHTKDHTEDDTEDEYEIDLSYDEDDEEYEENENLEIENTSESNVENTSESNVENTEDEEHESHMEEIESKKQKFQQLSPEDKEFILKLVDGTVENIFEIDDIISDNANGWTANRMARVDVTILRLAVHELMCKETPVGVVINEAVELAKKFGADESKAFVNGILGSVAKEI